MAGLICGCGKAHPEKKPVPGDTPETEPKQPKAELAAPVPAPSAATGSTLRLAATQSNIRAPDVHSIVGKIKTRDAVKLTVDWVAQHQRTVAAAARRPRGMS